MAQLDDQAAVVADDSTSAPAQTNEANPSPLDDMYPEDGEGGEPIAADETEAGEEVTDLSEADENLPEIDPPHSWKAEEKDLFKQLPRQLQEAAARRQAEVDRFAQSKAQEAAQVRAQVQQEALTHIQQMQAQYAQRMQQIAAQIEPQRPSYRLQAEDPDAFAEQMEAYEFYVAQRQQAQQQAHQAQQQAEATQHQLAALEAQRTAAVLQEKLPEFFDENEGPKLREQLGSIALNYFGYPAEELANASANEILGMKRVIELEAKAAKWDDLQKRKMESVRGAKNLPKLARPGAATGGVQAPASDPLKLLYPND